MNCMINNIYMNNDKINKDDMVLINFDNNIDNDINIIDNLTINSNSDFCKSMKYYLYLTKKCYIYQDDLIKTDSGFINIDKINLNNVTIDQSKIISISKNHINYKKKFILFKKDSLEKNVPNKDTILDHEQEIFFKDKYVEAKIFLVKYSDNVNTIEMDNINMFNIFTESESDINVNNMLIKSVKKDYQNYLNTIEKKYYEDNWNNINDQELFSHWKKYGRYENKNMFYKKELTKEEADLEGYKNMYKDLKNFEDDKLWNHWINNGKKEKRFMYYQLNEKNSDLKKYKKDYDDLINFNEKQLWNHWIKKGKLENRNLYFKFKISDSNLEKYRKDYSNEFEKK